MLQTAHEGLRAVWRKAFEGQIFESALYPVRVQSRTDRQRHSLRKRPVNPPTETRSRTIQNDAANFADDRNPTKMRHRIRASRKTVGCVSMASALAISGPALFSEPWHLVNLIVLVPAFVAMTSATLRATIEMDAQGMLSIHCPLFRFCHQLDNLKLAGVPKIDFRRDEQFGLKRLYRGTRLPSFNVGWFVLKNDAVAFVCLSGKRKARTLKTHDGFYILVDPRIARKIEAAATTPH